jgi:hypothetical protein
MEPSASQVPNREPRGSISIGFASDWVLTGQKTRVSRWAKVTMSSQYHLLPCHPREHIEVQVLQVGMLQPRLLVVPLPRHQAHWQWLHNVQINHVQV